MISARSRFLSAPATISDADAEPPLTRTASGAPASPPRDASCTSRRRLDTVVTTAPVSTNRSATSTDSSSRPPGFQRRSSTHADAPSPLSSSIACATSLEVVLENCLTLIRPTFLSSSLDSTELTRISARVMSNRSSLSSPLRWIHSVTGVLGSPRMRSTASSLVRLSVGSWLIFTMWSLAWMPARHAGVSFIGLMTVSFFSTMRITIPRPPNLPLVDTSMSRAASGSIRIECGSSVDSIPLTAAYSTSARSAPAFMLVSMKRNTFFRVAPSRHGESTLLVSNTSRLSFTRTMIWLFASSGSTMTSGMLNCTESSAW